MDSPDRLTARFRADWAAAGPKGDRAGLAVSGGPDSLALLLLAHAAMPGSFAVATVDHGLRDGSAAEAKAVARICAARGIAHAVLTVAVERSGNLQANARAARYDALGCWAQDSDLATIATAHHADDQAETLLMRLGRGAGVRGLAAMRPSAPLPGHPALTLLRPLLGWRRAELAAVVAEAGLVAAADPSNRDERFERVRMRAALAGADWLDPAALAASADALGAADDALEWAVSREWEQAVSDDGAALAYVPEAPAAVRLRVLERVIARLGTSRPRGAELARWLESLEAGRTATLAGVQGAPGAEGWRFVAVAPHRS